MIAFVTLKNFLENISIDDKKTRSSLVDTANLHKNIYEDVMNYYYIYFFIIGSHIP